MKCFKYALSLMVSITLFTACSDDNQTDLTPTEKGTVTDNLGNTYEWVQIGDLAWTTSNAKNGTPLYTLTYYDGWEYKDAFDADEVEDLKANYIPTYGNLMTYADAVASPPTGWRLPTDDDWKKLESQLGMGSDVNSNGWRGTNVATLLQKTSDGPQLNMKLGGICTWVAVWGWMELELTNKKEFGYYWTSTIEQSYKDIEAAYYRKLCIGRGSVERQCGKTDKLMSVRWVRDI